MEQNVSGEADGENADNDQVSGDAAVDNNKDGAAIEKAPERGRKLDNNNNNDDNEDRDASKGVEEDQDGAGGTPRDEAQNADRDDDAETPAIQSNTAFASTVYDFDDDASDNGVDDVDNSTPSINDASDNGVDDVSNSTPSRESPPLKRKSVQLAFHADLPAGRRSRASQFPCEFKCGKAFMTEAKRNSHHTYVHPRYVRYFACELCSYITPYTSCVMVHLRTKHAGMVNLPKYSREIRRKYVRVFEWLNPDRAALFRPALTRRALAEFAAKFRPSVRSWKLGT